MSDLQAENIMLREQLERLRNELSMSYDSTPEQIVDAAIDALQSASEEVERAEGAARRYRNERDDANAAVAYAQRRGGRC